jgi:hypothetical protein
LIATTSRKCIWNDWHGSPLKGCRQAIDDTIDLVDGHCQTAIDGAPPIGHRRNRLTTPLGEAWIEGD